MMKKLKNKVKRYFKKKKQIELGNNSEITINWLSKSLITLLLLNIISVVFSLLFIIWFDWELGLKILLTSLIFPYPLYTILKKIFYRQIEIEEVYEPYETDFDPDKTNK